MTESPYSESLAPPAAAAAAPTPASGRRARRTTRAATTGRTSRTRRRQTGPEALQVLKSTVDKLIKENRQLKRQLAHLHEKATGTSRSGVAAVERGMRTIQRKAQRALSGTVSTTRRRSATTRAAAPRRRRSA